MFTHQFFSVGLMPSYGILVPIIYTWLFLAKSKYGRTLLKNVIISLLVISYQQIIMDMYSAT